MTRLWNKSIIILLCIFIALSSIVFIGNADTSSRIASDTDLSPHVPNTPAISNLELSKAVKATVSDKEIWRITFSESGELNFHWDVSGSSSEFIVELSGDNLKKSVRKSIDKTFWTWPMKKLSAGTYRLTVSLKSSSGAIASAYLDFQLRKASTKTATPPPSTTDTSVTPSPSTPGNDPTPTPAVTDPQDERKHGGYRPRFSRRQSGGQNTGVTAGKALSKTHASGSGNLSYYNTVSLVLPKKAANTLVIDGETVGIQRSGGKMSVSLEEDVLSLTATKKGSWTISQSGLKLLARSGVSSINLHAPEGNYSLDTDTEFTGYLYGKLRAEGFVSSDFTITPKSDQLYVTVNQATYIVVSDFSLRPSEGNDDD